MKRNTTTTIRGISLLFVALTLTSTIFILAGCGRRSGEYTLKVLTTNDVHGSWFDSTYVDDNVRTSLIGAKYYVDSVRTASGSDNVLLIDAGDVLQGNNAAYYFNYVDTQTPHLYPRMAKYMGYDVVTVGNHDVETAHPVYDRVAKELKAAGIPFLGGNAIRNDDGRSYFDEYAVIKRAGLKVLVLGYSNANIAAWLDESIWSGMHFVSLIPLVQNSVDAIKAKVKPDVTIVSVHSGTGEGNGEILESQGLDLFKSLSGVDFLICAHDHRAVTFQNDSICLINSGSHARNLGYGEISVTKEKGKVVSKKLSAGLIAVDKNKGDQAMRDLFHKDYEAVKAFTVREIGSLDMDLRSRDAYPGMCDYMNLIHTVQLKSTDAQISFAAPLTQNGVVKAGTLIFNDMFTIYPFENQLYKLNLKGSEIKDYLEYSYSLWIQTYDAQHVLRIAEREDFRYGRKNWSFISPSFNFDSAAGIIYSVDVTKKMGDRIDIKSLADGTPFDMDATYSVAMTSYRASGGGDLLFKGAGLQRDELAERTVARYPEIRNLIYDFISENVVVNHVLVSDYDLLGYWSFMPQPVADMAIAKDMALMFGE